MPRMASPQTIASPWLTVAEAATYSRKHRETVTLALRTGALRGNQPGRHGRWLIHRDDIDAWIRGEVADVKPERVARPKKAS